MLGTDKHSSFLAQGTLQILCIEYTKVSFLDKDILYMLYLAEKNTLAF
jgi:hypothetical protein